MKVTVLGSGAWGTALAKILAESGHETTIWGRDAEHLRAIETARCNERLLPGVTLPENLRFTQDLGAAKDADVIIVSIPSQGLAGVVAQIPDYKGIMVSTTKGVDFESGLTMTGIISKHCSSAKVAALSGPTIAIEVAKHSPSAIVAASGDAKVAGVVQKLFSTPTFRVYSSTDLCGVELGGALKNVFAIAAGAGDGLGFGDNAKAALITRSIAEMRRLGSACGVQPETFSGLSGLGDLTVTCFSRHSRNRGFGEKLGRGGKPQEVLDSTVSVVEGFPATRSAWKLAQKVGVESPIIDEVHRALYEGKDVRLAVRDLMTRELKAED
jgi:glycerol-3-phosphate dehydrogenase (NAD(P)+)